MLLLGSPGLPWEVLSQWTVSDVAWKDTLVLISDVTSSVKSFSTSWLIPHTESVISPLGCNLKSIQKGALLFSQSLQAPACKHVILTVVPNSRMFENCCCGEQLCQGQQGDWNSDKGRAWMCASLGGVCDLRQLQMLLVFLGGMGLEILH